MKIAFSYIISNGFIFESLKTVLMDMATILTMSAKMATVGLLRIMVFGNKGYDVVISVHDFNNKILSSDSNCIVDVVIWPKFGNPRISIREVIVTSILYGFGKKTYFSWFKLSNLVLKRG